MHIDEQNISNVMDDEASAGGELEHIATASAAQATWARYHLIGDVLRDNSSEIAPPDFAAMLAEQIAEEPTVLAPPRAAKSVLKPVVGFAIAASVATLAVIGVQRTAPTPGGDEVPAIASPAVTVPEATDTPPALVASAPDSSATPTTVVIQPGALPAQHRLNSYLVKFNEQRSNVGVPGVNPYVRIVGFESE